MLLRLLKLGASIHAAVYRWSGGRVGTSIGGMRMLILTTKGRRSGKARSVALGYTEEGNSYVVIASYGGSVNHPHWYLNLRKEPFAYAQVREKRMAVRTQTVDAQDRERLWPQLVAKAPLYQHYQDRTQRQIPMVYLTPIESGEDGGAC